MNSFVCERCNYLHLNYLTGGKVPKKCPSCGSRRMRFTTANPLPEAKETDGDVKRELTSQEIYVLLEGIHQFSVEGMEIVRNKLRDAGVYILLNDEQLGELGSFLSKAEAGEYLQLIKRENYGLAVMGRTVVVVANTSIIRPHVGVNPAKLRELENTSRS